jgi:UDP-glucose 4-epimerase
MRDFLDIADFLAVMDIVPQDGAPTGSFNISSGEGHTIAEVFDQVATYLGIAPSEPVPIVPCCTDDVPAVVLDPARTEERSGSESPHCTCRKRKLLHDTTLGHPHHS